MQNSNGKKPVHGFHLRGYSFTTGFLTHTGNLANEKPAVVRYKCGRLDQRVVIKVSAQDGIKTQPKTMQLEGKSILNEPDGSFWVQVMFMGTEERLLFNHRSDKQLKDEWFEVQMPQE